MEAEDEAEDELALQEAKEAFEEFSEELGKKVKEVSDLQLNVSSGKEFVIREVSQLKALKSAKKSNFVSYFERGLQVVELGMRIEEGIGGLVELDALTIADAAFEAGVMAKII